MAGGSDHSGSVFRVGDTVELWRVIGMVSVLLLFVMLFEHLVHKLEHYLKKYPKYHDMMTKVFGELMILGLIGLGIKILKELGHLDPYSKCMIAFQAADLTIFIVAIALIIQSTIVFLRVRRKNIQMDKAELISTAHLVDHMARTKMPTWWDEIAAVVTYARGQDTSKLTNGDVPEVAQMRILRHYFLRCFGLPELFPFSKYLRQAQDNQITHMIEVEMSTWIILLLIAWGLETVATAIKDNLENEFAIVIAFLIFSWTSVLLNVVITVYFTWAIDELLNAAVENKEARAKRYLYLNEIAEVESHVVEQEMAADAIAIMQRVREEESMKKIKIKRKRKYLTKHDTGFQLIATALRKVSTKKNVTKMQEDHKMATLNEEGSQRQFTTQPSARPCVTLRWFSRKAWHFVVMSTLMLNAFYFALFCQCVIYQLTPLYHKVGCAPLFLIPLPLIINTVVFQPRILRNFILVSCSCRVDDVALGDVIDHFTETVQLRADFVQTINEYLEMSDQTLADVQAEFESHDTEKTGFLDLEEVRLVLHRFGFTLSFFRFNSVAKLLFDLNGIMVEYAQVMRLLEIGQTPEIRSLYTDISRASSAFASLRGEPIERTREASFQDTSFVLTDSTHYTTSPYVQPAQDSTPGSQNARVFRTKSSAINSLYRIDFEESTRSDYLTPGSTRRRLASRA